MIQCCYSTEPLTMLENILLLCILFFLVHWNAIYRPSQNKPFHIHENMCNDVGLLRFFPSITAKTASFM